MSISRMCAGNARTRRVFDHMNLSDREHWIFDMDGTLTEAVHDFEAIRHALGLPSGEPILEYLDRLPQREAAHGYRRLDEIEREIALVSRARPGAAELLTRLSERGLHAGILTRNSLRNAWTTLEVCGLDAFFERGAVMAREQAAPKPRPDGIHALLQHWGAAPASAVMVGDFLYDLQAGRAAGIATVHLDPDGDQRWPQYTDVTVTSLDALVPR